MRRDEFIEAMRGVVEELRIRPLITQLRPYVAYAAGQQISQEELDQFAIHAFTAHAAVATLSRDPTYARLLQILGLTEVFAPPNIAEISSAMKASKQTVNLRAHDEFNRLRFFYTVLEATARAQEAATALLVESAPPDGMAELVLLFRQPNDDLMAVNRLADLIRTLETLHDRICRIYQVQGGSFEVKRIESGSDVRISLVDLPGTIEKLSAVILEWRRELLESRYTTFDRKMAALEKGLSVLRQIDEQVKAGFLDPQTADQFKHELVRDLAKLTGWGLSPETKSRAEDESVERVIQRQAVKFLPPGSGQNDG